MIYTKPLINLSSQDTKSVGGKGASLGELMSFNVNVPNGFVISTMAFDDFISSPMLNLGNEIEEILKSVDINEINTVKNASEQIQSLILKSKIPENITDEILNKFIELDSKFVAVRSSATVEDGVDNAWAGQLDSFLNTTKDMLLEDVKKCWASLFTPRAIFYRFEKGLQKSDVSVAVVVQKMIESEKAGTAFSVHPVTQDKNQIIIEAGFGLGEAVVSGTITPDAYVISKKENKIIDININQQEKALYKRDNGGSEWVELGENGKEQVLTNEQILKLAKLIIEIEKHYGKPQDIEWAYADNRFYITQSRPITTL
jgi:pyruvate,water dikinase